MERRALLAFVISLVILVVYQEFMNRYYPPPETPIDLPTLEVPALAPETPGEIAVPEPREEAPTAAIPEGRDVVIETDVFRATFTTTGGRLKHLALHEYRTAVDPESAPLDLLANAQPGSLPLGIELRASGSKINDAQVSYRVDREELTLNGAAEGGVTFTGELDGVTVVKRIRARGNSYLVAVDLQANGAESKYSEMALNWDAVIPATHHPGEEVLFNSLIAIANDKLQHHDWHSIETLHEKDVRWLGHSGQYFISVMVPAADTADAVRMWARKHDSVIETQLLFPPGRFGTHVDLYLGPKKIDVLEAENHELRRAVDLGYFAVVALPLLQALKLSHGITGNYGVDIILLTVLIKVLFIPLTRSSFRSMREMQKLQPQMAKIRERFKDKPEEMNKEVMELYRRHKVNPLGGCLPMLLQMPVFLGLYNALNNAVELRHAPFAGWIRDLSAPDRLGSFQLPFVDQPGIPILTLLMGVSMFVQQWMTPSPSADPTQQRIMLIMPLMFTFMFINFPSGLTLYWLVNNIITIAQQYAMTRTD